MKLDFMHFAQEKENELTSLIYIQLVSLSNTSFSLTRNYIYIVIERAN